MDSPPRLSSRETLVRKLAKALAREGTHSPDDVLLAIESGQMQHWEEGDTVVVTSIKQYPRLKACVIFLAAGRFDEVWKIHDEQIVPWAKALGCTRMVGRGRMGWEKSARERGYGRDALMMSKEI